MDLLDLKSRAIADTTIVRREFHAYSPVVNSLEPNDEIRIAQNFADVFTFPSSSYLHIELMLDDSSDMNDITASNNYPCFLFDEVRLELYGITIAEARSVGLLSTVKLLSTMDASEHLTSESWGWKLDGYKLAKNSNVDICLPLRHLLNIFNDFQKIMVNAKLELILNRSKNDTNGYTIAAAQAAKKIKFKIKKLTWNLEHIYLSDTEKMKVLKSIDRGDFYPIQYRHWDFFSAPMISATTEQSLTLKTTLSLEKPRFVIVFFQIDRKGNAAKDTTKFDNANIRNIRLFLNDQYYPYKAEDYSFAADAKTKTAVLYHNFIEFRKAYAQNPEISHFLTRKSFLDDYPMFVINCEHQNDNIKSSVDVKLEFEASENFAEKTTAYVIIIHEKHFTYNALTNTVNRIIV